MKLSTFFPSMHGFFFVSFSRCIKRCFSYTQFADYGLREVSLTFVCFIIVWVVVFFFPSLSFEKVLRICEVSRSEKKAHCDTQQQQKKKKTRTLTVLCTVAYGSLLNSIRTIRHGYTHTEKIICNTNYRLNLIVRPLTKIKKELQHSKSHKVFLWMLNMQRIVTDLSRVCTIFSQVCTFFSTIMAITNHYTTHDCSFSCLFLYVRLFFSCCFAVFTQTIRSNLIQSNLREMWSWCTSLEMDFHVSERFK